jgi:hypothetical protein
MQPPVKEKAKQEKNRERDKDGAASKENKRGARIRESRGEKQMELSQGFMRKNRKLQGSDCKTKFPVDLKPN